MKQVFKPQRHKEFFLFFLCAFVVFCLCGEIIAAQTRQWPPPDRVGVDVRDQLPLSLNEAIALALESNKDINISRIDVQIAGFNLQVLRGVFDPVLSSESYYERRTTPVASLLGGGRNGSTNETDLTGNARLSGFSPFFGGNYQIDFVSSRLTTDNQFAALNPQFPSSLTFNYIQPLLRNLSIDDNRRQIKIAKKNLTLSDADFRQRAIEVIAQVQQAYWDLTFALRELQVQIEGVKQARLQAESNRRQVEQGILAPIDVVEAETQVTNFEQNVYVAQEAVTRAENNLKTLILPDRTAPLWSRALLPTTPVSLDPPRISLEEALGSALERRPELSKAEINAEINEINTRYYRNQTKPQIDLIGTYSTVGLAGTPVQSGPNPFTSGLSILQQRVSDLSRLAGLPDLPTTTPIGGGGVNDALIGGPGRSLSNLLAQNYTTARIGLRFSFSIGNRTAEANLGKSLAEGRRIQNQREQLEQQIDAEVRNALQELRSSEARLTAAAASRNSAEQVFASEQRKFKAGLSTVFLVLQRQTDLFLAQSRELKAQTDLNKAIATLQRAIGTTLEVNNITVLTNTPTRQLKIYNAVGP